MTKVRVENNLPAWIRKSEQGADMVLSTMATDILRLSKEQVPVGRPKATGGKGGGHLKASGILSRVENLKYRINYNKEYAAYQHRGMRRDGTHVVRNYSYPGSKAKYLSDPAESIWNKRKSYVSRYLKGQA